MGKNTQLLKIYHRKSKTKGKKLKGVISTQAIYQSKVTLLIHS